MSRVGVAASRATVIVDEQAAAKLRLADEYRHTWAHKPSWHSWR
ncbi:hypothetical protein [Calidifontibacter indicus]